MASSSLHGIILAEAYGVPATRMQYFVSPRDFDFKHADYYEGTGRSLPRACLFEEVPGQTPKVSFTVLDQVAKLRNFVKTLGMHPLEPPCTA